MGTRVSAEAAAIAREAQMRSEASEAARIAYVTQARTLRERRGSFIKMVVVSALVAAICSRVPPHSQVIAAPAPHAAQIAPQNAESAPI